MFVSAMSGLVLLCLLLHLSGVYGELMKRVFIVCILSAQRGMEVVVVGMRVCLPCTTARARRETNKTTDLSFNSCMSSFSLACHCLSSRRERYSISDWKAFSQGTVEHLGPKWLCMRCTCVIWAFG